MDEFPPLNSVWKHNESGEFYVIALISNKKVTKPGWVPMVTYADSHGELYTRPLWAFLNRCTRVEVPCETNCNSG